MHTKYTGPIILDCSLKPCGWRQRDTPSGPATVVILVVDYISCGLHKWDDDSFSIYPHILCKGNVQHFMYSEFDADDCVQLV